jgi:purine-binding chemotaxis protein CheW
MMMERSISSMRSYLIFQLTDRAYAVPTSCVEEIVPMAELSSVPGDPPFLRGFLNLGGEVIAVISMRRLLGMPDREPELYTPLVILKATPQKLALEIDRVTRITNIDDNDLIPLAEGVSLNDCGSAVARLDDQTIVLLSPERILLEQEARRAAHLATIARQRLAEIEELTA